MYNSINCTCEKTKKIPALELRLSFQLEKNYIFRLEHNSKIKQNTQAENP